MTDYNKTDVQIGDVVKSDVNTQLGLVETAVNSKLDKSGGTMTGDLDMNSNQILNLPAPTTASEPVRLGDLTFSVTLADAKYYDTVTEAKTDPSLKVGDVIIIKERASAIFDVIASTTNNEYDVIEGAASGTSLQLRDNGVLYFKSLGGKEDGTDETAVLSYAASLGKEIVITGNIGITSSITTTAQGTTFRGLTNPNDCKITVLSGEVNNPFEVSNVSDVGFYNIGFFGNSTASVAVQAGAIRFRCTSTSMKNLHVEDCYFENFKQNYWIYFRNDSTSSTMEQIFVRNNEFVSKAGNDIDSTSVGVPATCVGFQGSVANNAAWVANFEVSGNIMECSHMKRGIDCWGNTHLAEISGNYIKDAGENASENSGAYAMMLYTNRYLSLAVDYDNDPSRMNVHGNRIENPRDCGIYMQGLNKSNIHNNAIYGQYGTTDATLAKGAIVTNGVDQVNIHHNVLWDNVYDIAPAQINYKASPKEIVCNIHDNQCMSGTAESIKIRGNVDAGIDGSSGETSVLNFYNNTVYGTVKWRVTNVTNHFTLNIQGGEIRDSTLIGYYTEVASVPTPSGKLELTVKDVDFKNHPNNGINHTSIDYIFTLFDGNRFDLGTITAQCINITSSKFVTWKNNHFWASVTPAAGDYCVNVTSAEHLSWGNTMEGIDPANKQIGFVAPTWSAHEGEYVQTLRASEAGVASSKYILRGYIYSGNTSSWVEDRVLTGN